MYRSLKSTALFLLLFMLQGISPLLHAHPQGACGSAGVHEHLEDNGTQHLPKHRAEPAQLRDTSGPAASDCVVTISMRSGVKQAHATPDQDPPAALLRSTEALAPSAHVPTSLQPAFFKTLPPPRPNSRAPPSQLV